MVEKRLYAYAGEYADFAENARKACEDAAHEVGEIDFSATLTTPFAVMYEITGSYHISENAEPVAW